MRLLFHTLILKAQESSLRWKERKKERDVSKDEGQEKRKKERERKRVREGESERESIFCDKSTTLQDKPSTEAYLKTDILLNIF